MAITQSSPTSSEVVTGRSHPEEVTAAPSLTRYLDQSANALHWMLVEGEVDTDHFQLLATASLVAPGFRLDAHIIGASHLLRMAWGDGVIHHEVVACAGLPEDSPRLASARLASRPEDEVVFARLKGGRALRFESQILDGARATRRTRALHDAIQAVEGDESTRELGLCFEFPRPADASDLAVTSLCGPMTLVRASLCAAEDRLSVETAHSYPNEDRVVFTRTRVDSLGISGAES
jgi:hypothetical protein